jgi:hypothetical protein
LEKAAGVNSPVVDVVLHLCRIDAARSAALFPVPKGSAVETLNDLAARYLVFEITPLDDAANAKAASR